VIILAFPAEAKEPASSRYDKDVFEYVSYVTFKDHAPLTRGDNTVKDLINKDIRDIILIKKDMIVNRVLVKEGEVMNTSPATIVLCDQTSQKRDKRDKR
jgi:hypothetical protein